MASDDRRAALREILASADDIANPIHAALHVGCGLIALGAQQTEVDAVLDLSTSDEDP